MKYLFCFISLIIFNYSIFGQEKSERFTINLDLMHPVYLGSNPVEKFSISHGVEFLLNIPLYKRSKLSTGVGVEYGKHHVVEEVAYLVWVNDNLGWIPYERTNYWNLDFFSLKMPVYVSMPFHNSFLDSYTFGVGFGYLLNYKLTEEALQNTSQIKINRSFLDLNIGVKKELFQFNKVSLGLSPDIGYRAYLSDRNDWQKKCFFGELKFSVSF